MKMEAKLDQFIKDSAAHQANIKLLMTDTNKTLFTLNSEVKQLRTDVGKLDKKFQNLETKVTTVERNLNGHIEGLKNRVVGVEKSADFISKKFDEFKVTVDNTKVDSLALKQRVDHLQNELDLEKQGRNQDQQYFRSSFFVKIHGIPMQKGEEDSAGSGENIEESTTRTTRISTSANNAVSSTVLREIFTSAGITGFAEEQVDVCHRTSKYYLAPIIILFDRKQDRENLFRQRHKLQQLNILEVHLDYDEDKIEEWRVEQKKKIPTIEWGEQYPKIIIREHLSHMNNELLKAVLPVARSKNYRFPGYLTKGNIHVRKSETSKPIAIRTKADIDKIV